MSHVNPNPPMSLADLHKVERTQSRWEDLESQYQEILAMFDQFMIYPQEARKYNDLYTPEERGVVKRLIDGILFDLKQVMTSMDELRSQHLIGEEPRKGWVYDNLETGELFTWLGIAASYRGISENIQAIMAQPLSDLTVVFTQVQARMPTPVNLSTVELPPLNSTNRDDYQIGVSSINPTGK